jgi:hypothetical protein
MVEKGWNQIVGCHGFKHSNWNDYWIKYDNYCCEDSRLVIGFWCSSSCLQQQSIVQDLWRIKETRIGIDGQL